MTARDDAIEAGLARLAEATRERIVSHGEMVEIVVDAVEPIIRADEREKCEPTAEQIEEYATALRVKIEAEVRERIAQEIERTTPRMKTDRYLLISIEHAARIARGDS